MKKILCVSVFILFLLQSKSQDTAFARKIVNTLASKEFQGRGYVNNGNLIAAKYLEKEYKNLGLQPFGKSHFQKFPVAVNTFPGEILFKINETPLIPGIDYLVEASSPGIKGKFDILSISRKDIDSKDKFIKLIQSAANHVVYLDNTDFINEDKESKKQIDEYISFLKYSPEFACNAVIIYRKNKLDWDASTAVSARPVIITNREIRPDTLRKVTLNIENKFYPKYETQNVIGFLPGKVQRDSFIVITAHYDHLGKMGNETIFPGANDNASGVAMMLSLARYYSQFPPKYTLVCIALSAEELGILGAAEFTEHPLIPLNKIKFLVNFDLAGTGEEGIKVVNGSVYKDKFDLLTRINEKEKLMPKIDIRGAACNSDHCLFYQKGVPCFYIYTQGGIKAYHDIYDKAETLPLTEFKDYCTLMIRFFDSL